MDNLWKLMFENSSGLFFRFLFSINLRDNKNGHFIGKSKVGEGCNVHFFPF